MQGTDTKYMLVLDDRVFYHGLIGHRMKSRRLGALSFYLAPEGACEIQDAEGQWRQCDLAVVPPYQAHRVRSRSGVIINVLIEPDRLDPAEADALIAAARDPENRAALVTRMRAAAPLLHQAAPDGDMSADGFDRLVLGRTLMARRLDSRIAAVIDALKAESLENQVLASDLADSIGLSASRFLHLFKEQTGVSFRNYRVWHRARSFLMHANHDSSLTDVALSLGYPDSSHFSHSIRKTYGLKPRSIRVGSQNLYVASSPGMAAVGAT